MAAHDLLTTAAPVMKRFFDDRRVYNMAFKNRPLFAWIPKKTGVTGGASGTTPGHGYQVPITIDDIPGESSDFASAVAARAGTQHRAWLMDRRKRYATATIDWETVRAMRNDLGAFMTAVTPLIDSAINQLSNSIAHQLYHNGTGSRGVVDAGYTTGTTVQLENAADETNMVHMARTWSLGRRVTAATLETGGTVRAETDTTVDAIDLTNGILEFSQQITSLTAGDYIFVTGDHVATGKSCIEGMGSWMPDPTGITGGDDHYGVDRSVWKERLLGLHQDIALQSTKGDGSFIRGIREAAAVLQANEGAPDALFVHPTRWAQIESDLASQSRYEMMMGSDGYTGFDTIVINAGGGKINVVADPWCPPNNGYLLQRDTWQFFSIDRFPDFVSDDGNRLHRLEGADEVEFRMGGYGNLVCTAPGHNMVLNFLLS